MPCSACKRDLPTPVRGLCAPCYGRWKRSRSVDQGRTACGVGGCTKPVVSHGLCDAHRKRMARHNHLLDTRPDSWGAKEKHPLYQSWSHIKRSAGRREIDPIWLTDFLQFVADVGDRPSPKHKLFSADDTQPLGPRNFVWKRAITERVPGEAEATYMNRAQKVYRSVRSEAFQGYELKKNHGLTASEYAAMSAAQDGKCAICGKPETAVIRGNTSSLAVDHCHTNGHVRALLCSKCNTGLGLFNDDPERLKAALAYLNHHEIPPKGG